jgi:ankyrin repeat protein
VLGWQDQYTPLWWAAFNGYAEVAKQLVEAKASVEALDDVSKCHRSRRALEDWQSFSFSWPKETGMGFLAESPLASLPTGYVAVDPIRSHFLTANHVLVRKPAQYPISLMSR